MGAFFALGGGYVDGMYRDAARSAAAAVYGNPNFAFFMVVVPELSEAAVVLERLRHVLVSRGGGVLDGRGVLVPGGGGRGLAVCSGRWRLAGRFRWARFNRRLSLDHHPGDDLFLLLDFFRNDFGLRQQRPHRFQDILRI